MNLINSKVPLKLDSSIHLVCSPSTVHNCKEYIYGDVEFMKSLIKEISDKSQDNKDLVKKYWEYAQSFNKAGAPIYLYGKLVLKIESNDYYTIIVSTMKALNMYKYEEEPIKDSTPTQTDEIKSISNNLDTLFDDMDDEEEYVAPTPQETATSNVKVIAVEPQPTNSFSNMISFDEEDEEVQDIDISLPDIAIVEETPIQTSSNNGNSFDLYDDDNFEDDSNDSATPLANTLDDTLDIEIEQTTSNEFENNYYKGTSANSHTDDNNPFIEVNHISHAEQYANELELNDELDFNLSDDSDLDEAPINQKSTNSYTDTFDNGLPDEINKDLERLNNDKSKPLNALFSDIRHDELDILNEMDTDNDVNTSIEDVQDISSIETYYEPISEIKDTEGMGAEDMNDMPNLIKTLDYGTLENTKPEKSSIDIETLTSIPLAFVQECLLNSNMIITEAIKYQNKNLFRMIPHDMQESIVQNLIENLTLDTIKELVTEEFIHAFRNY